MIVDYKVFSIYDILQMSHEAVRILLADILNVP